MRVRDTWPPSALDPYRHDAYASYPLPPVFRRLREVARDRGIYVVLRMQLPQDTASSELVTHHLKNGRAPVITVRTRRPLQQLDDTVDSIALAHELGHYTSFLRSERSDEYEENMCSDAPPLMCAPLTCSRTLREEAFREEVRAWMYAREDLTELGFVAWAAFDAQRTDALASYRGAWELGEFDGS